MQQKGIEGGIEESVAAIVSREVVGRVRHRGEWKDAEMELGIGILSAPADEAEDLLPICRKVLPDFLRCVDVRGAVGWRWIGTQKRDNADKDGFNSMDR